VTGVPSPGKIEAFLLPAGRYKKNEMTASMMNMMISHFAIAHEKPATPLAPSRAAMMANTMNNMISSNIIQFHLL
jgi:hypothetical protein